MRTITLRFPYKKLLLGLTTCVLLAACASTRAEPAPPPTPTLAPAFVAESQPSPTVASLPTHTPTPTVTPAPPPALATPTASPTSTPRPTVAPDLAFEFVTVHRNEVLSVIASRHGVSVDDILAYNPLANADQLAVGQGLRIPHFNLPATPSEIVLADSELVNGPAYRDFDIAAFVARQPGYLASYHTRSGLSGAEVVARLARAYSVGPRVLLALLEARGGWLTQPAPQGQALSRPLGHLAGAEGLWAQVEWTADTLNRGFYGWQDRGETAIRFRNGALRRGAPGLNAGTVALQVMLAQDIRPEQLAEELNAFRQAYRRLFGHFPPANTEPVLSPDIAQPFLQLPWGHNHWWYLTGGPHGGWGSGSGWAALDFVPETPLVGSCGPLDVWALAAADGVVAYSEKGELLLDLDGDGDWRTGWVLQYLHISDRPPAGTRIYISAVCTMACG